MAKYNGPVCRFCRREGEKLFIKGDRCYTEKCAFNRRGFAPGQHGQKRTKLSEFGAQLREKQKVKRVYGLLERPFRNIFKKAAQMRGVTAEIFFRKLELRLDNVVFRMGFASTRQEGKQIVRHNHILINGKRVNLPGLQVKVGDIITVSSKSTSMGRFASAAEQFKRRPVLPWVEVDHGKFAGKIIAQPQRDDLGLNVKERLIVELYSK